MRSVGTSVLHLAHYAFGVFASLKNVQQEGEFGESTAIDTGQ
jgi:hypothetical protein